MDKYYLKSLRANFTDSEYFILKKEIRNKCDISNDVWKNWLTGRTKIPGLAKPIIREIVSNKLAEKKENFELILDLF